MKSEIVEDLHRSQGSSLEEQGLLVQQLHRQFSDHSEIVVGAISRLERLEQLIYHTASTSGDNVGSLAARLDDVLGKLTACSYTVEEWDKVSERVREMEIQLEEDALAKIAAGERLAYLESELAILAKTTNADTEKSFKPNGECQIKKFAPLVTRMASDKSCSKAVPLESSENGSERCSTELRSEAEEVCAETEDL